MPEDPRDQDTDLEALGQDDDPSHAVRLRWGVTAEEATHHEPLEVSLAQEEPDEAYVDDGVWDDDVDEAPVPPRHRGAVEPDELDEELVAPAAESDAVHPQP